MRHGASCSWRSSHDVKPLIRNLDAARLERTLDVRVILHTREDCVRGAGPDAVKALAYLQCAVPIYRWPTDPGCDAEAVVPIREVRHACSGERVGEL